MKFFQGLGKMKNDPYSCDQWPIGCSKQFDSL